jgi:hypothetical protein
MARRHDIAILLPDSRGRIAQERRRRRSGQVTGLGDVAVGIRLVMVAKQRMLCI